MPTFETPRLHLRPLGGDDEGLYCRLYTDPEVMRHIGAPLSAEAARTAFATVTRLMRQDAPTMRLWALRDRGPGVDIGILALLRHAHEPGTREIGTMLLVAAQGRGFAVEAQTALLDWVFDTQGVGIVCSSHAPGHGAVIGVKHRLGFVRAGRGGTVDADVRDACAGDQRVHWQISLERWRAARPACDGKA